MREGIDDGKNKLQTVGRKRKTAAAKMLKAKKVALKGDNPLLSLIHI